MADKIITLRISDTDLAKIPKEAVVYKSENAEVNIVIFAVRLEAGGNRYVTDLEIAGKPYSLDITNEPRILPEELKQNMETFLENVKTSIIENMDWIMSNGRKTGN